MNDLERFLAAVRMVETGSYEGVYDRYDPSRSRSATVGAYGFLEEEWPRMAALTGIPGAPWQVREAQDWVAGHMSASYFYRYGSWDMAAVAWIGGTTAADRVMGRRNGLIGNPAILQYASDIKDAGRQVPANLPPVAPMINISTEGWIHPVAGSNDWSGGSFMYRRPASAVAAGRTPVHEGIDIYAEKGTPIVAPSDGVVLSAGYGNKSGYYVKIRGNDGTVYYMAHMHQEALVKKGQAIQAGWHVGLVGNSGNASGTSPHLHFTMKNDKGQLINPAPFLGAATRPYQEQTIAPTGRHNARSLMGSMYSAMAEEISGGERVDYRALSAQRREEEAEAGIDPMYGAPTDDSTPTPRYEDTSVVREDRDLPTGGPL